MERVIKKGNSFFNAKIRICYHSLFKKKVYLCKTVFFIGDIAFQKKISHKIWIYYGQKTFTKNITTEWLSMM